MPTEASRSRTYTQSRGRGSWPRNPPAAHGAPFFWINSSQPTTRSCAAGGLGRAISARVIRRWHTTHAPCQSYLLRKPLPHLVFPYGPPLARSRLDKGPRSGPGAGLESIDGTFRPDPNRSASVRTRYTYPPHMPTLVHDDGAHAAQSTRCIRSKSLPDSRIDRRSPRAEFCNHHRLT